MTEKQTPWTARYYGRDGNLLHEDISDRPVGEKWLHMESSWSAARRFRLDRRAELQEPGVLRYIEVEPVPGSYDA